MLSVFLILHPLVTLYITHLTTSRHTWRTISTFEKSTRSEDNSGNSGKIHVRCGNAIADVSTCNRARALARAQNSRRYFFARLTEKQ